MSELRAATISNLAGTGAATLTGQTAAKAWFNLTGTGTIVGNASHNVSSYTDNGTGDYTSTFTTAFSDANYGVSGITRGDGINFPHSVINSATGPTTSACRFYGVNANGAGTIVDVARLCAEFLR